MGLIRHAFAVLTLGAALAFAGCAYAPAPREDAVAFTDAYARHPGAESMGTCAEKNTAAWWECYGSTELDALVEEALAANPGVAQVRARVEQAAAAARLSMADLLPSADVRAGRGRDIDPDGPDTSSFTLRGAASYELDVFGGNRAAHRSDRLAAAAAAQDVRAAEITLTASIVENWLRLMSAREEEALLRAQLKTNRMVLDLQNRRYEGGIAGALDVLQQKEVLARTESQLPDVQAEQELLSHQLSILAGRNPSRPLGLEQARLPAVPGLPETGVPSQLLQSRPDVAAAWLRVMSADWAAQAARARRFPVFDLSADYATTGGKFSALFDTWALNLALDLAMPVIDGGARAAEQARRKAMTDERFLAYRETVLRAIGEVEDALSLNHHRARKIAAIKDQLEASRNALEQAQVSYSNGNTGYISVLNSLIATQSLEQQLVRARRDLALARVALFRAIGLRTGGENAQEGA